MDNLEGSQRPQGEDVRLDRRLHTTEAQAFAGTRALHTKSCVALLGRAAQHLSSARRYGTTCREAAQHHQMTKHAYAAPKMGRILRNSPTTSTSVQLNVHLGRKGTISCESSEDTSVRTVVWAQIVPDRVRSYDLPLGRDSWDHFSVRKYKDTNEEETIVTFTPQDEGSAAGDHCFKKWVDQVIGMI